MDTEPGCGKRLDDTWLDQATRNGIVLRAHEFFFRVKPNGDVLEVTHPVMRIDVFAQYEYVAYPAGLGFVSYVFPERFQTAQPAFKGIFASGDIRKREPDDPVFESGRGELWTLPGYALPNEHLFFRQRYREYQFFPAPLTDPKLLGMMERLVMGLETIRTLLSCEAFCPELAQISPKMYEVFAKRLRGFLDAKYRYIYQK